MAVAEAILFWVSITAYVAAGLLCAFALVFRKERLLRLAVIVAAAGLAPHAAAFIVRWVSTGRPPFISLYELVLAGAWFVVAAFAVAQFVWKGVRPLGTAVMPVAFLSMGVAMMLSPEANPLTAALRSWWLAIHILFALTAYGCFAVAFGAAVLLLVRERAAARKDAKGAEADEKRVSSSPIPTPERLDEMGSRCIFFGFICHTVMILSGSIWANNAWGRFWGWDPVETWSLVTWLVYGLYAHLRFVRRWKPKHAAWLSVSAFVIVVFSFWGVPHLWKSIHDYSLMSR